jgi:uncharacterized surface protein with fasciclin (FAS1) repeats
MKTKITCILFSLFVFAACSDQNEEHYTTFEEDTLTTFLKNNEIFSEFYKVMYAAGLSDLLNAYGTYTCFAPTNEAMRKYYETNASSFEQLSPEQIREIAYSHVLSINLPSKMFPEGIISSINLDERYLYVTTKPSESSMLIYVNDDSRIVMLDQKVHNGVVHGIDAVLKISKIQLPDVIQDDKRFSLFAEALFATGLSDSMMLIKKFGYVQETVKALLDRDWPYWDTPPTWRYGYTALIESDSTYADNKIHNLNDLTTYAAGIYDKMYPEDKNVTDITNRRNSLNRFVAYHLLNSELAENEFIPPLLQKFYTPGTPMVSYFMPLCPNTLLEVQTGVLFNKRKDGTAVRIISPNHVAQNGVYHEINEIMVFDEIMINDVLNKRIRIDAVDVFPELASNKLRNANDPTLYYLLPKEYLKNVIYTEMTEIQYRFCAGCINYRGDEVMIGGRYDFTMTLPPIPAGTYEVRIGYAAGGYRGVAQLYFDGQPCGIPLDMRIVATDPKIGWIDDGSTEDNGIENDKMMHNRGYMKAPETAFCQNFTNVMRKVSNNIRLVLGIKTFEKMQTHTLRAKSVMDPTNMEFQIDYLEFVPINYLQKEGRD